MPDLDLEAYVIGVSGWCEQCEKDMDIRYDPDSDQFVMSCKCGTFRVILDAEQEEDEIDDRYFQ